MFILAEERPIETVTLPPLEDMYARAELLSDEHQYKLEQRIQALRDKHVIMFPEPALCEVMHGLVYANATQKIAMLNDEVIPDVTLINVSSEDWASAWQL